MVGLGVIFMTIPILFTALRLWAKTLSGKGYGNDEILLIGALLVTIACSICQIVGKSLISISTMFRFG